MKNTRINCNVYFLFFIGSIFLVGMLVFVFGKRPRKEAFEFEFNVDTISVNQPELDIEPARFYLVEDQWGYSLIQFKDADLDKSLDKVFCDNSGRSVSLESFNPDTGFPSDKVFEPNSTWEQRFKKVLQEHEKKLKRMGLSK